MEARVLLWSRLDPVENRLTSLVHGWTGQWYLRWARFEDRKSLIRMTSHIPVIVLAYRAVLVEEDLPRRGVG
jgi:hypothetical protein